MMAIFLIKYNRERRFYSMAIVFLRKMITDKALHAWIKVIEQEEIYDQMWLTVTTVRSYFHRNDCTAWESNSLVNLTMFLKNARINVVSV
ncbi:hypothetical protein [Anaerostipes sp. MSJ-23]|uniref:hypothetical protein n=1 Tax=Anaerostipes sp. MSJ-23 TaxID=2841520 RepID=UPI001C0F9303|nr:hypothetical protein [Anaerostipes sp. MSJ-23]MBU5460392.1 hypothetical protein [Anaerostipes sp. MSJ-23]